MSTKEDFLEQIKASLELHSLVKLTLSKPTDKDSTLHNIFVRPVEIKSERHYSFTYRYKTNDETKNHKVEAAYQEIMMQVEEHFKNATLCTPDEDIALLTSKKGKITVQKSKANRSTATVAHDKIKTKRAQPDANYLTLLGVTDHAGNIIPKMADKYRQINKFLEIMESLIGTAQLPKNPKIVDMGSGKGYLTFALYEYMRQKGYEVSVTGIELRKELVDFCNETAKQLSFEGLQFVDQPIEEYENKDIDILIALHACDTATDDALAKGLASDAALIVTAPCCHKQVRQQLKGKAVSSPILKYGIFKERQYEMVTDTIRALILEREGYESKIFEFVSNEHTRKNVMLVGINHHRTKNEQGANEKISAIKSEFGLDYQQLERLIDG